MSTRFDMGISEIDIQDFDFIWDNWMVPLINKLPNQMDAEFKEKTGFSIRDLEPIKVAASKYFVDKRDSVKKEYYGNYPSVVLDKHLMDFHKLSSVLCRTMIENKVYTYDVNLCIQYWLVHNALINFRLAFYSSIVLLYQSMLFRLEPSEKELYEKLKAQKRLNLYTAISAAKTHESFENSLVLDLAKRDINNRSFDCFLYSTIMYQLEEYNKMLLV